MITSPIRSGWWNVCGSSTRRQTALNPQGFPLRVVPWRPLGEMSFLADICRCNCGLVRAQSAVPRGRTRPVVPPPITCRIANRQLLPRRSDWDPKFSPKSSGRAAATHPPKLVASRIPVHGFTGIGSRQRQSATGAAANGIPLKTAPPPLRVPP